MVAKKRKSRSEVSDLGRAIARGDFAAAKRLISGRISPPKGMSDAGGARTPPALMCGFEEISVSTEKGPVQCCMRRRGPVDLTPPQRASIRQYIAVLRGARQYFDELNASAALCHVANASPEEVLLVSANAWLPEEPMLFLVGVAFCEGGELRIEQYLARDERQEPAVCQAFGDRCAAAAVVATVAVQSAARSLQASRRGSDGGSLGGHAPAAPGAAAASGSSQRVQGPVAGPAEPLRHRNRRAATPAPDAKSADSAGRRRGSVPSFPGWRRCGVHPRNSRTQPDGPADDGGGSVPSADGVRRGRRIATAVRGNADA